MQNKPAILKVLFNVWVKAPGALLLGSGSFTPRKIWDRICKILQFSAFYPENGSQCRPQCILRHFNMWNTIPIRSRSFWTMGMALQCVPL